MSTLSLTNCASRDVGVRPAWRLWLPVAMTVDALVLGGAVFSAIWLGQMPDAYFKEGSFVTAVSTLQIIAMASLCAYTFHQRRDQEGTGGAPSDRAHWIWLLFAVGALGLAFDEAAAIHESIDAHIHELLGIRETPLSDRIDDLIVLGYGLAGLWALWLARKELRQFWPARSLFALGFALFFVMVALDLLTNSYSNAAPRLAADANLKALAAWANVIEDSFKLLSESGFIVAFAAAAALAREPEAAR